MKCKLKFVKISNEHKFAGVGFAGNMFIILNALTYLNEDEKLYVDMVTNDCVCSDKNFNLYGTNNCWEYYFEQTNINNNEEFKEFNSLLPANISYENRDLFINPNNFINLKNKFYNNFELRKEIKESIDEFYLNKLIGKTTLGVQIRLTDMKHYHNVSSVDKYINKINEILIEKPEIEQIFLATDDGTVIKILETSINKPIIYYDNMFRANEINLHKHPYDRYNDNRENHLYKMGVECLQDILILSKCDYMLKADVSSISIVAGILSENIKEIYRL